MTFGVTIQSTASPVQEEETLKVDVLVENTGEQADTQRITLSVDGTQRDETEETLENGQSTTVTLTWATEDGDAGTYTAVAASADDRDSTDILVEEDQTGPSLDVTIDWTNGPITEGERLCLSCTVTNTGGEAGEGTVAVGLDTLTESKKKKLALDAGQSDDVHFEIESSEYREGNEAKHEKKIWADTGTHRDEVTVSVSKPAHFAIDIQSTNGPVEAGENIETTATIENTGGETGHGTVALAANDYNHSISNAGVRGGGEGSLGLKGGTISQTIVAGISPPGGGTVVDSIGLELAAGASEQVTLEWDTGPSTDALDPGNYALGVVAVPTAPDDGGGWLWGDEHWTEGTRSDAAVVTVEHGPMRTGHFIVELDGEELAGASSVTIPGISVEQDEYRETDTPNEELWGRTTFDDLEMERGVKPGDTKLHDWFEDVRNGAADAARKEIAVKLLDEQGVAQIEWQFQEAWVKDYDPPELDASADGDVATESITVAYDRMMRDEV